MIPHWQRLYSSPTIHNSLLTLSLPIQVKQSRPSKKTILAFHSKRLISFLQQPQNFQKLPPTRNHFYFLIFFYSQASLLLRNESKNKSKVIILPTLFYQYDQRKKVTCYFENCLSMIFSFEPVQYKLVTL